MENNIDYQEYQDNYKRYFNSLNCDQMIDIIEYLKGKSTSDEFEDIEDCAIELVTRLLKMDRGRSCVIEYTKEQKKFIKSKYLSNYFKESIKEMLGESISKELLNILNCEKNISEMTEEEIKIIKTEIDEFYRTNGKSEKWNISSCFMPYIYKLNSEGTKKFIINNTYPAELAKQILNTSGLNPRSSYYSGRGVNYGDLNDKHLAEIYRKLLILEPNYAKSFVWLVDNMRTLGATEFIDSFINLGHAGFDYNKFNVISDSNISLDGLQGNAAFMVGAISFYETSRRGRYHRMMQTENMKLSFHARIYDIHEKLLKGEKITEEDIEMIENKKISYFCVTNFYEDEPYQRKL